MKNIAIIYGSSTDNTKNVAKAIAQKLSGENVYLKDISNLNINDLDSYQNIILGTSTWGLGDLQDDWDSAISNFKTIDLEGKTVAFFGLGDSSSYSDTFVNGMGLLYEALEGKGFKLTGQTPTDGYSFDESAAVKDGKFVGLVIDEDNESNLTEERLNTWITKITPDLQ